MTSRATHYVALLATFLYWLTPGLAPAQVLKGTFAAGPTHALSIHADGSLWAVGSNQDGQLGDGTTTLRSAWVPVSTATNWVQVAAGVTHSLALRTDGTLWGWGANDYGQLGSLPSAGSATLATTPVQLPGTYVQVAASGYTSLALRADGTLWSWGANDYGQLGNATANTPGGFNAVPTQVPGTYVQMAAGYSHSLALRADGSLWAWGSNVLGQLGTTTNMATQLPNPVPVQVPGTYTQVAAGSQHSLALRADGTLWAWGSNQFGQLANPALSTMSGPNPVPWQVAGTYTRLAAGAFSGLALSANGTLSTWGLKSTATIGSFSAVPTAVAGTYVQLAAGNNYYQGLRADGSLWTWGYNTYGQLGTGPTNVGTTVPTPAPVESGTALPTRSTAAGNSFGLAVRGDGTLWSWGDNVAGQLGDGTTASRVRPAQVGTDHDWVQVVAGYYHALARKADGTVWAWGSNVSNQAGGATTPSLLIPTLVNVPAATSIAAGEDHNLALTATGAAYAWGGNGSGQLGIGTTTATMATPTPVMGGLVLTQLAAGQKYSVGLTATGTLYAWGTNEAGQLGSVAGSGSAAPNPTPAPVPNLAGLVAVMAGDRHALGLTATGTAYAWGGNLYGQLGNAGAGGSPAYSAVPTLIAGLAGVRQAGAYAQHNLALLANGTIYSWGLNQWGALGQGTFSTVLVTVPAPEATLGTAWAQLSTGSSATASLVRTASAQNFASAGYNLYGQLGDGTTTNWPRFDRMSPLASLQPLPVLAATSGAAFELVPNPAHEQATAVGLPAGTTLAVYDALGRLVATSTSFTCSVAGLPAGLYLVRATAPGQAAQTARLLVE